MIAKICASLAALCLIGYGINAHQESNKNLAKMAADLSASQAVAKDTAQKLEALLAAHEAAKAAEKPKCNPDAPVGDPSFCLIGLLNSDSQTPSSSVDDGSSIEEAFGAAGLGLVSKTK